MPDILNRVRQRTGRMLRELVPHHTHYRPLGRAPQQPGPARPPLTAGPLPRRRFEEPQRVRGTVVSLLAGSGAAVDNFRGEYSELSYRVDLRHCYLVAEAANAPLHSCRPSWRATLTIALTLLRTLL